MPTLLHVDSSPRGDYSVSRKLTAEFVSQWREKNPGGRVIYRDLYTETIPPLDLGLIGAFFTPEAARSEEQKSALSLSDKLVSELETADQYVFGVPMFNFSIPGVLKLYIDQIARAGKTFAYDSNGPRGLLIGKKTYVLSASGGSYPEGTPMAAMSFGEPYLRAIFGFLGLKDVTFVNAENIAKVTAGQIGLEEHLAPTLARVRELVAVA
jgi:FMN-dependent NADH-azoreductase